MARNIVLDEIHLTVHMPRGNPAGVYNAALRTLKQRTFLTALRRAVGEIIQRYPSLARVRFTISR